jgi:hypothetical protein
MDLGPTDISLWGALVAKGDGSACISYPPMQIPEFHRKFSRDGMKFNTRSPRNSPASEASFQHLGSPIHITCNIAASETSTPPTLSPAPTVAPMAAPPGAEVEAETSRVFGYDPHEYNQEGLMGFMEWLTAKYQDNEFVNDSYYRLQEKKLGIDLLKDITSDVLVKECDITLGTAFRIVKGYMAWQKTLDKSNTTVQLPPTS